MTTQSLSYELYILNLIIVESSAEFLDIHIIIFDFFSIYVFIGNVLNLTAKQVYRMLRDIRVCLIWLFFKCKPRIRLEAH